MSTKHPIIAITGSSGAGTTSVTRTFQHIFRREKVKAAFVEGDAFHRYDRDGMRTAMAEAARAGNTHFSHFGPEANLFEELEALFRQYGETGRGRIRRYLHEDDPAAAGTGEPGTFTGWEEIPEGTDLLFYEGLHGGVVTDRVNVARYPDLLVGVVPIVNLEWIQKIHRDKAARGFSTEAVLDTILRRMPDYVHYICPQFSRTHVNFQRVPTVDTSNPFVAREIPTADESFVVIRFRDPKEIDFQYLLTMLHDSFMSRPNSIVVPGGKMGLAMQLIFTPLILQFVRRKRRAAWARERHDAPPRSELRYREEEQERFGGSGRRPGASTATREATLAREEAARREADEIHGPPRARAAARRLVHGSPGPPPGCRRRRRVPASG